MSDLELREHLLEIVDYARFEQEWANLQIKQHKPTGIHREDCGVCKKMDTLNGSTVDQILALIKEQTRLAIKKPNSLLRSALAITEREISNPRSTNWQAFRRLLETELEREHKIMFPAELQSNNGEGKNE